MVVNNLPTCDVTNYQNKHKEEIPLVQLAKMGDIEAIDTIFERYQDVVGFFARSYYLPGGEYQDLFQEGLLGLWKAVRDFNSSLGVPFYPFAKSCISRKIKNAIEAAMRQKQNPLNYAQSFSQPVYKEGEKSSTKTVVDMIADSLCNNPESIFLGNSQKVSHIIEIIKEKGILSYFELDVLYRFYVLGKSYKEISNELETTPKTTPKRIDYALYKAKIKIRRNFTREDFEI